MRVAVITGICSGTLEQEAMICIQHLTIELQTVGHVDITVEALDPKYYY